MIANHYCWGDTLVQKLQEAAGKFLCKVKSELPWQGTTNLVQYCTENIKHFAENLFWMEACWSLFLSKGHYKLFTVKWLCTISTRKRKYLGAVQYYLQYIGCVQYVPSRECALCTREDMYSLAFPVFLTETRPQPRIFIRLAVPSGVRHKLLCVVREHDRNLASSIRLPRRRC